MSFLLRTDDDYRICYGEPKSRFVITSNGTYFCADEYQQIVDEEKEVECHALMDADNFPLDGWADVCQNDGGRVITKEIAEYLLDGDALDVNTFIEIGLISK